MSTDSENCLDSIDEGRGIVSGVRLELIMVITRLDFFLMQFRSFVSNFNSLVTVISISQPAELIGKLHGLHQRTESVLEMLRMDWA
jgi:hypothetical protein